ncbi:MAG: hypothetical protein WED05_13085 [Candidatus Atabeyarchaeum deiterrae]
MTVFSLTMTAASATQYQGEKGQYYQYWQPGVPPTQWILVTSNDYGWGKITVNTHGSGKYWYVDVTYQWSIRAPDNKLQYVRLIINDASGNTVFSVTVWTRHFPFTGSGTNTYTGLILGAAGNYGAFIQWKDIDLQHDASLVTYPWVPFWYNGYGSWQ